MRLVHLPAVVVLGVALLGEGSAQELVLVPEAPASAPDKVYHRPGCVIVRDGKGVLAMQRDQAESRGFKTHRECDPASEPKADATAKVAPARGSRGASPPRPETVFVEAGGTHYHRKECKTLTKAAKPVALTTVGKRWPCTVCRPPFPRRTGEPVVPRWRG